MKILVFEHTPTERPGMILNWFQDRGHTYTEYLFGTETAPPNWKDYDGLLVMGGPMGVYETGKYFWLDEEVALLKQAIGSLPVLGICLGAQLLSHAMGGRVWASGKKEIGWFPVDLTPRGAEILGVEKGPFTVLHWHGDTFSLPEGAVTLGESSPGFLQGFLMPPSTLALQFHLEVGTDQVESFIESDREYIATGLQTCPEMVQSPDDILTRTAQFSQLTKVVLFPLLDRWLESRL